MRFSLDACFLYVSSSLPQPAHEEVEALCGQIAVFELRSAKLVLQLSCHQKSIRLSVAGQDPIPTEIIKIHWHTLKS